MASHFPCIGIALKPRGLVDLVEISRRQQSQDYHATRGLCFVERGHGAGSVGVSRWNELPGHDYPFLRHVTHPLPTGQRIAWPHQDPQQVALQGWVGDDYPIVFDCPDYYVQGALSFPHECEVQFALFPEQVSAFGDKREFEESQRDRRMKFAPQSFTPSGLFVFGEGPPRSEVMASGEVVSAKTMTNPLTQSQFVAVQFEDSRRSLRSRVFWGRGMEAFAAREHHHGRVLDFGAHPAQWRSSPVAQSLASARR